MTEPKQINNEIELWNTDLSAIEVYEGLLFNDEGDYDEHYGPETKIKTDGDNLEWREIAERYEGKRIRITVEVLSNDDVQTN